jgi:hypothetical protein
MMSMKLDEVREREERSDLDPGIVLALDQSDVEFMCSFVI